MPEIEEKSVTSPGERPATLGVLRASGWQSRPVKEELRANAARRIAEGRPLVEAVLGYSETVLPDLERAILAGHDLILLGERGQAKTRIMRSLVELLDEWIPVVAGSEINDDPFAPVSTFARELVAEKGDDTPIAWRPRDRRYTEKLATPDTSIADLIGEVDPIKVAEGRYLADESTLHFGLVPRANRGIFAINELPDLAERIQVGLLNVLEERDVQVRGYTVRLPLDVVMVASANPEDYTNRGRIITPLKDRFGSQVRTHYPVTAEDELAVVRQEAQPLEIEGVQAVVPPFLADVVVALTQLGRKSPNLNQRSGLSVRMSIANYEVLQAAAARRALRLDTTEACARPSDLPALLAATAGKVEIEALEESREGEVLERLLRSAVLAVWKECVPQPKMRGVTAEFEGGAAFEVGEDVPDSAYTKRLAGMPELRSVALAIADQESAAHVAAAAEFVLEGLHLSKRLNKHAGAGAESIYRA
ncbi:MAG: sigma 54-interacting transcriptional regulator [Actinomycetota bacterium]|nr:sigma 54-interacting transcriptional regulator [Actinomycetota bacterium]